MRKFHLIATGALLSLVVTSNALADNCDPAVVVVRGSSASQPIIEAVAAAALTQGIKVVYDKTGSSCGGGVYEAITPVDAVGRVNATMPYTSYDAAAKSATCTLLPATIGRAADIAVSDVYATSCAGIGTLPATITLPADVAETLGPVQAFTLAVHDDTSFPVAISSEAAFNIFGVTARNGDAKFAVAPWNVIATIYGRFEDSGTWQTWARNLGLITQKPTLESIPTPHPSSTTVLGNLNAQAVASAIGIIALNDIIPAGGVTPQVRALAFKAKGQDFAYYTSSTATGTDMINVRDGHYQTWANLHFFARKTGGDYSPAVKTVLGLLENQDVVAATAKLRAVPKCAMQVSRSSDGGDFSLATPAAPCGCFFEASASGVAPATCKTCTGPTDTTTCGSAGQCVFGYCEAK